MMTSISKRLSLVAMFAFAVFLSACQNDHSTPTYTPVAMDTFAAKKSAWLRDHLPAGTLAYTSVPTLWNMLLDPKADGLHALQNHPKFIEQWLQIRNDLHDNYINDLPVEAHPLYKLAVHHVTGPFEMAFINDSPHALMPSFAMATTLDGMNQDQLNELLAQSLQPMGLQDQVKQERNGDVHTWSVRFQNMNHVVRYDSDTGRLLAVSGMTTSLDSVENMLSQASDAALQKILDFDKAQDPSGLNMRMWLATQPLVELGMPFLPSPQIKDSIQMWGIDQAEYLWMGTQSHGGGAGLKVHVMMPDVGWRTFVPRSDAAFDITLAGEPKSVIQLTLPTQAQWDEALKQLPLKAKDHEDMAKFSAEFKSNFGFELNQMLDAYHQQIYFINDKAGRYMAMKIKDQAAHQTMSEQFYQALNAPEQVQSYEGVTIHHTHFSSMGSLFSKRKDLPKNSAQISRFLNLFKQHQYWTQDGDVIYMSNIPQILADRENSRHPQSLKSWLEHNGTDWNDAFLAYGTTIDDLPRNVYHGYLAMMQGLADLAGSEFDPFAFPTAQKLPLPDSGRFNLAIKSSSNSFSFEINYHYSMLEPLMNPDGAMVSIAVVAILASYSIPAYRDYTIRAKIGQQMAYSAALKVAVSEHFMTEGHFKGVEQWVELPGEGWAIDPETGAITIPLYDVDKSLGLDQHITLTPQVTDQSLYWKCESNVPNKWLPASCRY